MEPTRQWTVGVDLSTRSHGALRFAQWLFDRTHALGHRFVGVHVMRPSGIGRRQEAGLGPRIERARQSVWASARGVASHFALSRVEVLRGGRPAQRLLDRVRREGFGLIVGRVRSVHGWSLRSFGPTARRLVRRMPVPTAVVPPDLEWDELDPGPVMVTVVPERIDPAAIELAQTLGRQLGRPVLAACPIVRPAAHPDVLPMTGAVVPPPPPVDREASQRAIEEALRQRLRSLGIDPPGIRVGFGPDVCMVVQDLARDNRACFIVASSGSSSLADRLLRADTGRTLAGHADRPVLLVPVEG